jgi:hypothetical protein
MAQLRKVWSVDLSRRCLLRRAASIGGAAVILASGVQSAMASKIPQAAVAYQGSPKGAQSCSNCRLFEPPSACKSVEGVISPNGWCKIYVKA